MLLQPSEALTAVSIFVCLPFSFVARKGWCEGKKQPAVHWCKLRWIFALFGANFVLLTSFVTFFFEILVKKSSKNLANEVLFRRLRAFASSVRLSSSREIASHADRGQIKNTMASCSRTTKLRSNVSFVLRTTWWHPHLAPVSLRPFARLIFSLS